MGDGTKIEWADATWNPIVGCSIVSPGCTNCYAMRLAGGRMRNHPSRAGLTTPSKAGPVWNGEVRLHEPAIDQPLRWGKPRRIFVCAHGDLFHEAVPDEWIDRVFEVCGACDDQDRGHTFMVLSKRSERQLEYLRSARAKPAWNRRRMARDAWPPRNMWLGVSVEDQQRADERIPALLATPAAVRFLSCEPLLGPIDLLTTLAMWQDSPERHSAVPLGRQLINWVIVGGESGPDARPMNPEWARSLRDQCAAAGVSFFMKQMDKKASIPADLMIREFPV